MEKENYETYEYLPASGSNSEAEPYQFFVVQDDGTFLINRQVQYVTQVQDKEVLEPGQPCAMVDVAPQQFYVDVDTTAGMISVPEQFNGPDGSSNLYASNYLLQPASEAPVEEQLLQNVNDPKPTTPESGKESETSPKPSKLLETETDGAPNTATKSNPEKTEIEHNILQDADEENNVTFAISFRGILEKPTEEDDLDIYGKLFAMRLRRYPKSMRYIMIYKIDGFLLNNPYPDERASSASSYLLQKMTFCWSYLRLFSTMMALAEALVKSTPYYGRVKEASCG